MITTAGMYWCIQHQGKSEEESLNLNQMIRIKLKDLSTEKLLEIKVAIDSILATRLPVVEGKKPLSTPIEELNLSSLAYGSMKKLGINTVSDMIRYTPYTLSHKTRGFSGNKAVLTKFVETINEQFGINWRNR